MGLAYIVDRRGWIRYCPGSRSVPPERQMAYKKLVLTIQGWIYSWMKPLYCETEEEYLISKALFSSFMKSHKVIKIMGNDNAVRIMNFVRDHVEQHEECFVFFRKKVIRYYETDTNSGHEGTNGGLKTGGAPVKPQFALDKAAAVLTRNANIRVLQIDINGSRDSTTNKLWLQLPATAPYLTNLGENLVRNQWKEHDKYFGARGSDSCIHVKRLAHHRSHKCGHIPKFIRVRVVKLADNGCLTCSCFYFERTGICCRHIMYVLVQAIPSYTGVTHKDISVVWWNMFYQHACRTGGG
jgi:hypothetical protein